MKRLISRKNVGTLYHYTDLFKLYNMLKTDTINAGESGYVSLTRNQNFHNQKRVIGSRLECRLALNGTSISDNYKIRPYHDVGYFGPKAPPTKYEQEEVVCKPITNLKSYIEEITIYKSKFNEDRFNDEIIKYLTPEQIQQYTGGWEPTKFEDTWSWHQEQFDQEKQRYSDMRASGKGFTFDQVVDLIKTVYSGPIIIE
jgi:hypothetical protein